MWQAAKWQCKITHIAGLLSLLVSGIRVDVRCTYYRSRVPRSSLLCSQTQDLGKTQYKLLSENVKIHEAPCALRHFIILTPFQNRSHMLYFVEHTPVDPVRMTYSNGYQNARTGVGSKVLVFIRPCDPLWVHRGVFHKIACDFYFETEQVHIYVRWCTRL